MKYLAVTLTGFALWLWLAGRPSETSWSTVRDHATRSRGWREGFAGDLLRSMGNDHPSEGTVRFVVDWTLAEDSGDDAWGRGNPLNTTLCTGADTGACEDPVAATRETLENGLYTDLVKALLNNDPESAKGFLLLSSWSESHYGYGRNWP